MKKSYINLLISLMLIFSMNSASGQVFTDDFESGLSKWTLPSSGYTIGTTTTNPAAGSYSLDLTGTNGGHYNGMYATFTSSQPDSISWKIKWTSSSVASGYVVIGDANTTSNSGIVFQYLNGANGLRFYVNSINNIYVTVNLNQWYFIALNDINWTNKTFDIYVDGVKKYDNFPFRAQSNSIDRIHLYNFQSSTNYYDDIYIGGTQCTSANITTEPLDSIVCSGGNAMFDFVATGSIDSFRWESNSGSGWSAVANSNNDTLTITNATQSAQYRGIAFAACGNDTTRAAQLTVNSLPTTMLTSSRNPSVNGYAPYQCSNLKANAAGYGSLGISWAHGPSTDSIQACPTVGQWYKVTVTDGHGCVKTDSIRQFVINASSPYGPNYGVICYNYPRRPYYYTLTVRQTQIPYYLSLGATLGACGSTPSKRGEEATFAEIADLYTFYPNPMSNTLHVDWFNLFTEEVSIDLLDMTGKVVKTLYNGQVVEGELSNLQADMTDLHNGMYLLRFSSNSDYRINKVQLFR